MTVAAIDSGKSGAVGIIYDDGSVKTIRAPKVKGETKIKEYDCAAYAAIARHLASLRCPVAIEDIHAVFGSRASSTFSMGYGYGVWGGALGGAGIKPILVKAKDWRKHYWEKNPKDYKARKAASIAKANELFPRLEIRHDGEAEALLIAGYLRDKLKGAAS